MTSLFLMFTFLAFGQSPNYSNDWQNNTDYFGGYQLLVDDEHHSYAIGVNEVSNNGYLTIKHYDSKGTLVNTLESPNHLGSSTNPIIVNHYIYLISQKAKGFGFDVLRFHRNKKLPEIILSFADFSQGSSAGQLSIENNRLYFNLKKNNLPVLKSCKLDGSDVKTFSALHASNKAFESKFTFKENGDVIFAYGAGDQYGNPQLFVKLLNRNTLSTISSIQQSISSTATFHPGHLIYDNNEVFISGDINDGSPKLRKIHIWKFHFNVSANIIFDQNQVYFKQPSFGGKDFETREMDMVLEGSYLYLSAYCDAGLGASGGSSSQFKEVIEILQVNRSTLATSANEIYSIIENTQWSGYDFRRPLAIGQNSYIFHFYTYHGATSYQAEYQSELNGFDLNITNSQNLTINTSNAVNEDYVSQDLIAKDCYVYSLTNISHGYGHEESIITRHVDQTCLPNPSCFVDAEFVFEQEKLNLTITPDETLNEFTTVQSYSLSMGDGTTYSTQDFAGDAITHEYANPGVYEVCLTVVGVLADGTTCTDVICKTIEIKCYDQGPCRNTFTRRFDHRVNNLSDHSQYCLTDDEEIIVAHGRQLNPFEYQIMVSKLDKSGNLMWSFLYKDPNTIASYNSIGYYEAQDVIELSNSEIVVTGITKVQNGIHINNYVPFFLKLDAHGGFISYRTYDNGAQTNSAIIKEMNISVANQLYLMTSTSNEVIFSEITYDGDVIQQESHEILANQAGISLIDNIVQNNGTTSAEITLLGNKRMLDNSSVPFLMTFNSACNLLNFKEYTSIEPPSTKIINGITYTKQPSLLAKRIITLPNSTHAIIGQSGRMINPNRSSDEYIDGFLYVVDNTLELLPNISHSYQIPVGSSRNQLDFNAVTITPNSILIGGAYGTIGQSVDPPQMPLNIELDLNNPLQIIKSLAFPKVKTGLFLNTKTTSIAVLSDQSILNLGYEKVNTLGGKSVPFLFRTNEVGLSCSYDNTYQIIVHSDELLVSQMNSTSSIGQNVSSTQSSLVRTNMCNLELEDVSCDTKCNSSSCEWFNPVLDFNILKCLGSNANVDNIVTVSITQPSWNYLDEYHIQIDGNEFMEPVSGYFPDIPFQGISEGWHNACVTIVDPTSGCFKTICKDFYYEPYEVVNETHTIPCTFESSIPLFEFNPCEHYPFATDYAIKQSNTNEYFWDTRLVNQDCMTHPLFSGSYEIDLYDENGCNYKKVILTVESTPVSQLNSNDNLIVPCGSSIDLNSHFLNFFQNFPININLPEFFEWKRASNNEIVPNGTIDNIVSGGNFVLTIEDPNNCTRLVYTVTIEVQKTLHQLTKYMNCSENSSCATLTYAEMKNFFQTEYPGCYQYPATNVTETMRVENSTNPADWFVLPPGSNMWACDNDKFTFYDAHSCCIFEVTFRCFNGTEPLKKSNIEGEITMTSAPNPTNSSVEISINVNNWQGEENGSISVVNDKGQIIQQINNHSIYHPLLLNLGQYNSGLYFIIYKIGEVTLTSRIMVVSE